MAERDESLGNYEYAQSMHDHAKDGSLDLLSLEYLQASDACACGPPNDVTAICKQYESAGVDLLLCLVNPHGIAHENVMQTIELVGRYVIPEFVD